MGRILNTALKRRLFASPSTLSPVRRRNLRYSIRSDIRAVIGELREIYESDERGMADVIREDLSWIITAGPGRNDDGSGMWDDPSSILDDVIKKARPAGRG